MRRRHVLVVTATALALTGMRALVACTEITPTTFGNPNSLDRKNLPGEGGVEAIACSGIDGGGGAGFDGGCPSFATDIYPSFTAAGAWKCSNAACHGGTSVPPIDGTNPANCIASLKKIAVMGVPYLSADGGKDPAGSSILCNIQGVCGSPMPKVDPKVASERPTQADLCKIEAWLKCGAPP